MRYTRLPYRSSQGFTLIELVLYVALAGIMTLALVNFVPLLLDARIKNQTIAEVEQQGMRVVQIIDQAIRNADAIDAPDPGDTNDALDLFSPGSADQIRFDLAAEAIEVVEAGLGGVALTNDRVSVSDLQVQNLSRPGTPGYISFRFTITYRNPSGSYLYDFSRTFYGGAALKSP